MKLKELMPTKLFDLLGKRALVTGSSQGIGLAIAGGLAGAGAETILNGRDRVKLESAVAELRANEFKVHGMDFDVTSQESVVAAIAKIETDIGPIEILVNNAGMQFRTPLEDFPPEKFRELMRVNVESAFLTGQAVARHMIKRGRGKIINVCSVQSELGRSGIAPYTATKGAVLASIEGDARKALAALDRGGGTMACCRFDGHRDKVFYRTGGTACNEESTAASSSLRR